MLIEFSNILMVYLCCHLWPVYSLLLLLCSFTEVATKQHLSHLLCLKGFVMTIPVLYLVILGPELGSMDELIFWTLGCISDPMTFS